MIRRVIWLALPLILCAGCTGEQAVEPSADVTGGPKLSAQDAQQYQGIIQGSRKSQQAKKDL